MIRHNSKGMQRVPPLHIGSVVKGLHDHIGNSRMAEVPRAKAAFIQQTI
ncbi:MAG TPA: hypothetical protein VH369_07610 [Bryobacteraceae bacterium]